jgi:cyclopropane fatty-acyl-phospholipid synthase-like methyltransferase
MSQSDLAGFFRGQHYDALLAGWKLADAIDLSEVRHFADIAGGSGGLAIGLCQRVPEIRGTVLDLPEVAAIACTHIDAAGLGDRIAAGDCDLKAGPVVGGYDLVIARALLQVLAADDCRRALRNIRPALAPGGRLVILGQIVGDDRLGPATAALFNLVFLSFYEGGRAWTVGEHAGWLSDAGFEGCDWQISRNGLNMIIARAPAGEGTWAGR